MNQRGEVMGTPCARVWVGGVMGTPCTRVWMGGVMGAIYSCVDGRGDGRHVLVCGWEG